MKRKKLFFIFCTVVFIFFITTTFTSCIFAGTYNRKGNTATLYMGGRSNGSATVSGNTLSGNFDGQQFSATKVNTGSNPFAGTWKGTDADGDSVELVFGDTILMAYYSEDIDDIDEENVGDYEYDKNKAGWEIDDNEDEAEISGNRLKGTLFEIPFSAVKSNTSSNPFTGTWKGRVDGTRFEIVIGETTWAVHIFY
jgi:hypothetical protein